MGEVFIREGFPAQRNSRHRSTWRLVCESIFQEKAEENIYMKDSCAHKSSGKKILNDDRKQITKA